MGISGVPSVIATSAITTAGGFDNSIYTVYLVIDRQLESHLIFS